MKIKLLTFFILLSFGLQAQTKYFSYISDRRFWSPELLYGYTFKPKMKETIDGEKKKLSPEQYSFTYSGNYLYVKGSKIEGVYSVNNIMPAEYGFKMNLMNARDPSIQGHLKMVLNDIGQVEAMVLKRSRKEQEIIFHMAVITSKLNKTEAAYFTDLGEYEVESVDSLWGDKVYPFILKNESQYRFQREDSTYIEFIENYKVIDKRKAIKAPKVKSEKKGKKKKGEVVEEVEEEMEEEEMDTIPGLVDLTVMSKVELEKYAATNSKVRIEKEYFIILNTFEDQEDGTRKLVADEYQIKGVDEREDTSAKEGEERFQVDFTVDGKKHIYMFLLEDRTLSSIELGFDKFLMRGH
ncbi:MAG: hypothetical protein ACI94Y_001939 [Maribacter sp.]|jgi:hypothetical protein